MFLSNGRICHFIGIFTLRFSFLVIPLWLLIFDIYLDSHCLCCRFFVVFTFACRRCFVPGFIFQALYNCCSLQDKSGFT